MTDKEKLESYFISLGLTYEKLNDGTWLINDADKGVEQVFVVLADPVVIVRVSVMTLPEKNREKLFEAALRLNADGLVHVAYAVEDNQLVLSNSFLIETLDIQELQAAFDDIGVALTQHYSLLSQYRNK